MARQKTAAKTVRQRASKQWFIRVRGSNLPNSWQGWLTYLPFIAYLVAVMVTIGDQTSSPIMKGMMLVVQFIAAGVVMTWVAATHS